MDEFVPGNVETESISIVEKLTAQYKKLVELADGIAITNATISSFVDLGTTLRDLLSSFSMTPFSPRRQSATPNRQTPSKRCRQNDEISEESNGNDNMYDNDGDDDDNTSQYSPWTSTANCYSIWNDSTNSTNSSRDGDNTKSIKRC